ncbi:MAG TPA: ABC transporter ATP-binding protein [Actinomycetota bacterium]|nr:ABC transporter ATP-binding protein [Actinomycetota bacterium]
MTSGPLLEVGGLTCAYGAVTALRDVDLEVHPNEVVCVLGVNGAGKSTLLAALAGAIRPVEGSVRVAGDEVTGRTPEQMVGEGVVLVPEGRQVFASLSVRDNLLLGAYRLRRDRAVVREGLDEVHRLFPVLAQLAERPAGALSGGEQQMLAIGRALMGRPRLLMLDEPSLGLAPRVVGVVMEAVAGLAAGGRSVLLVEQLARIALQSSHRGYLLESGRVALVGTSEDLQADDRVREIYMGVRR